MFKRLILPTDGSDRELAALEASLKLAKEWNAEVLGVTVLSAVGESGDFFKTGGSALSAFEHKKEEASKGALERLSRMAKAHGVKAVTKTLKGSPADEIVKEVRDGDLIVMPTKGLALTKGGRLGSVTARVVELSPCPVLVFKAS